MALPPDLRDEIIQARIYYENYGLNGVHAERLLDICDLLIREIDKLPEEKE